MKNSYFTLLAFIITISSYAQSSDSIDMGKLQTKSLMKLINTLELETKEDIANLEMACFLSEGDTSAYSFHTNSYIINAPIETTWKAYKTVSPTHKTGKKDFVSFGMLYSKSENTIYYPTDDYNGMNDMQTVFWNLRMMGGLVKISVAQTINNINDIQKSFRICYLQKGISHGTQFIKLEVTADGKTKVTHDTYFKSHSKTRDKRLYPKFHEKAIDEFHEMVKEYAERKV